MSRGRAIIGPMPTGKISAARDHLARIVGVKPVLGVAELVWNALDAEAQSVDVEVTATASGAVDQTVVTDDGHGFGAHEIDELFSTVGGSWKNSKADRKTKAGLRLLHGQKGEGRWRAFSIGDKVTWESVTPGEEGKPNQSVTVTMLADRLDEYSWTGPEDTDKAAGTCVTVVAGMKEPNALLEDGAADSLAAVVALYLTEYPELEVLYQGRALSPEPLIARRDVLSVEHDGEHGPATLTVLEWKESIDRALFLCDENGVTLHQAEPRIHAPGFQFTAYVSWAGFRVHESLLPLADLDNDQIAPVIEQARQVLRDHFRERRHDEAVDIVRQWKEEEVYPYSDDPSDEVGTASQALFNYVAIAAAPAVNSIDEKVAKAMSLQTMRIVMETDPSALEVVLSEVLALSDEKLEEFRSLLDRTPLTAILSAVRMVTGRLDFLAGLEHLVYDPSTAPAVLERAHLHKILEGEPWVFGEEFALHVSDQSLTSVLKSHIEVMGRDELVGEPVTDTDGKSRRVDFMLGRALEHARNKREHLVVEIKRPSVTIDRDEIGQIEDYAQAVVSDSRFDRLATDWDFVLVGTKLSKRAETRANQEGLARGLVSNPRDSNVRVWVRSWGEIIEDAKHRLKFVRSQLEYDPDTDQALAYLREKYPGYLPVQLVSGLNGQMNGSVAGHPRANQG